MNVTAKPASARPAEALLVDRQAVASVIRPRDAASTLPRALFLDPRVYEQEIERLFRTAWLCVGRGDELPDAEPARVIELGGSRWTLRRVDGAIRAVADPSGGPSESLAVRQWRGFLFVSQNPDPMPLESYLGPFARRASAYPFERLRLAHRVWYEIRANWKLILENATECYHCPGVHPQLVRITPYLSGEDESLEGPAIGGWMELAPGRSSLTAEGRASRSAFPDLDTEERRRIYYYSLFPANFFSLTPDYVTLDWFIPLAPARTLLMFDLYVDREEADPADDAMAFWDATNRQDWRVCELAALGSRSSAFTQGRYSELESMVHAVDRYYVRSMGLADP